MAFQVEAICEKQKKNLLDEIRKCEHIVIYGNGELAYRIKILLQKNGLISYSVVVDDEYKQKLYSEEDSIIGLSDLIGKDVGIIIAMFDYPRAIAKLKTCGFSKLYCFHRVFDTENIDGGFLRKNRNSFLETYNWLKDDESKKVFEKYVLSNVTEDTCELHDIWINHKEQYLSFIDRLEKPFIWINGGGYIGDTILAFYERLGQDAFEWIYSFEPDKINYQGLVKNIGAKKIERISVINKGLSNHDGQVSFCSSEDMTAGMKRVSCESDMTDSIEVTTIDGLKIEGQHVFINLDVEGSKLATLRGAKETIRRYKPALAISVYHKKDDLITIPQYLRELRPDYEFYLRLYMPWCEELVLYAF